MNPAHNELLATLVAQDTLRNLQAAQNNKRQQYFQQLLESEFQNIRNQRIQGELILDQFREANKQAKIQALNQAKQQFPNLNMYSGVQQGLQPIHNELLNLSPVGTGFPGGEQWQQQADLRMLPSQQQFRQQIGNELSFMPPVPGIYPGGSEYLQAAGRNAGIFGTQLPPTNSSTDGGYIVPRQCGKDY